MEGRRLSEHQCWLTKFTVFWIRSLCVCTDSKHNLELVRKLYTKIFMKVWTCVKLVQSLFLVWSVTKRRTDSGASRGMIQLITSNPGVLEFLVTCNKLDLFDMIHKSRNRACWRNHGTHRHEKAKQNKSSRELIVIHFLTVNGGGLGQI